MRGRGGAGAKGPPKQPLPKPEKHDWSHVIVPRGGQLLNTLQAVQRKQSPVPPPPPYSAALAFPVSGVKQASPNHYAEAWGIELARAAFALTASVAPIPSAMRTAILREYDAAKRVVLDAYVPRELGPGPLHVGLWASEQGCPDSHDGQHLNGVSMARVGAFLSQDLGLLAATEALVLANARALLCVATPILDVWQAGMRSPGKPTSSAASAWLRAVSGVQPRERDHSDDFWLATRAIEFLVAAGDPLLKRTRTPGYLTAQPCILKYRMEVYRAPGGHLSTIPEPIPGTKEVCSWVMVNGGTVTWGVDWTTPAPTAGLSLLHVFPGNAQ